MLLIRYVRLQGLCLTRTKFPVRDKYSNGRLYSTLSKPLSSWPMRGSMLSTIFFGKFPAEMKKLVRFENLKKYFLIENRPNFFYYGVKFFETKIADNGDPDSRLVARKASCYNT